MLGVIRHLYYMSFISILALDVGSHQTLSALGVACTEVSLQVPTR